jgi:hypothetical protein
MTVTLMVCTEITQVCFGGQGTEGLDPSLSLLLSTPPWNIPGSFFFLPLPSSFFSPSFFSLLLLFYLLLPPSPPPL